MANIQCLNQEKYTILEEAYLANGNVHNIVCLTETQLKEDNIRMGENVISYNAMRDAKGDEKKGGGLMILHRKNKRINFEKIENRNKNLLEMEGECYGLKIRIVLAYFDTDKSKEGGQKRNKALQTEIEKTMKKAKEKDEAILVLGDFNGHIGLLGHQKQNQHGKVILKWIEEDGLTLLNLDEKCEGVYTWSRGDQKSVIDYALVNRKMYNHFVEMKIDENKEEFEESDHHLISIKFKFQKKGEKRKNKWIKREYFTTNKSALKIFREKLEQFWKDNKIQTINEMDKSILKVARDTLLRVYKRKMSGDEDKKEERPWMNDNIREEMKLKREINRKKRNTKDEKEKANLERKYKEQKEIVKRLIREGITNYEIKITNEIKEDGNSGRKLWENINKLIGRKTKEEGEMKVYNEQEQELNEQEMKREVPKYWKEYHKGKNEISQVWNKENHIKELNKKKENLIAEPGFMILPGGIFKIEQTEQIINPMTLKEIGTEAMGGELEKLKCNKAPGPNLLKPELYKEIGKSTFCTEVMANLYDNQFYSEEVPESWKESKTKLIAKKKKPTVKDFRPIALTNISYKLFMSLIKNQIEEHLTENNLVKYNQTGFTKGGRMEDNLFILQHLVGKSFKREKPLIVISIDFSKAYDSIDRKKMIETMIRYKIHPNIIDIVAKIYQDDFTNIIVGDHEERIEITSGIRQGCTGSTTLFKLITYEIIKELERNGEALEIENTKINSLFFADDSLTMADTIEKARKNLKILTDISESYGLKINKEKSKILLFNCEENIKEIEGIQVTDKIKYLGITIDNKKELFESHKTHIVKRAKSYANMMYLITGKCVNRMLMGKTYWKNMIVPRLLYGSGVMTFNAKEIAQLQIAENIAYRRIMEAREHTPISALRGEIGSSLMITRIMESKLLLTKNILEGSNNLTKKILEESRIERKNKYNTTLSEYLRKLNIRFEELKTISKVNIKDIAKKWDSNKWKADLKEKSSLKTYRTYKLEIKEEKFYDNRDSSKYLFQARTNTLPLNTTRRHTGGDTKCELCNYENEDLIHFLIDCKGLEHKRNINLIQKNLNMDKEKMVGNILFGKGDKEKIKTMIEEMWKFRLGKKLQKEKLPKKIKSKEKNIEQA